LPAIRPFKGLIYNPDKINDLSRVVAPPYDIIPPAMQDKLYHEHPENIVRLILGKIKRSDAKDDNRYTRAKRDFASWLKRRVLISDDKKSLYLYSQIYLDGKKRMERAGFIGLMEISMGKKTEVLPHEDTLLAPKLDRLNLLRSVRANLSPIFVLYDDPAHKVLKEIKKAASGSRPFIDIVFDGVRHKVWRISSLRTIRETERLMRPKKIFIADGHHRYETARSYAAELEIGKAPEALKKNSHFLMAYFVESDERMLTILPAHRLIKDIGILKRKEIPGRLKSFFAVKKVPDLKRCFAAMERLRSRHAFGMYLGGDDFYLLRLKDIAASDAIIENNSTDWKRLDVTILHFFLIEDILGIRDDDDNIEFVKEPDRAAGLVKSGKFKICFFLNPTTVSQVKRIASLGEKMPRKATYFYPKPLSGLVINPLC
jgi:uncharacterized protein (DUF1015 family)